MHYLAIGSQNLGIFSRRLPGGPLFLCVYFQLKVNDVVYKHKQLTKNRSILLGLETPNGNLNIATPKIQMNAASGISSGSSLLFSRESNILF